ncbi:TPA: hypothetical protein M4Y70_001301 [Klebsiella variicola]|uniref:hypothetical protein n=1 Tax=Klebsiella variicola TaxID=244366 RepID=UPI000B62D55F|nr:hypothetical protein [Klebsiella variicola]HBR2884832.1 hypothetical protein [Klebsiella pneumoniae]MCJ1831858.1 hypothetical protein [Klebsiella variicola subsp. variicola]OUG58994.1 hypothetical protein AZZ62_005006 [Klebsiella variicola]SXE67894.1 Uncharacterised protein [Klebsiella variicola]HBQ0384564.1 hypothetical protein [Klebsiella variicola]
MLRRLCFWVLFAVVFLVAWRLAGMLMDMVLLVVIVGALAVCWRWPFKRKA